MVCKRIARLSVLSQHVLQLEPDVDKGSRAEEVAYFTSTLSLQLLHVLAHESGHTAP